MRETTKGILAMIGACLFWGLCSIYYKLLSHVPAIEVLAHRTLWSFVFFTGILVFQGRISSLYQSVTGRKSGYTIAFAALAISINWFVFISAVQGEQALEASLGYYIFPLVSVVFGAVMFRERLGPVQWLAVALAGAAVLLLTVALGVAPWVSLFLAISFGLYGVAKKRLDVGPVVSVTGEVLLLSPVALILLAGIHAGGGGTFGTNLTDSLMLMFSGILTGTPLILFSYAAKRVTMATVGLLQYINPTLQFLVATLLFQEGFTLWHALAFAMIWVALAIYSLAAWRKGRGAARLTGP